MPLGVGKPDDVCEFAINFLLSGQGDAKRLAVKLVKRQPKRPALEVALVMSIAASSIEEVFASPQVSKAAADAWRMAALLAVDLHMMQGLGLPHSTCADVLTYWQTIDGYFLT